MPRVMVIRDHNDPTAAPVLLDENVRTEQLSEEPAASHFLERLGWAISDAEDAGISPTRAVEAEHEAPRRAQGRAAGTRIPLRWPQRPPRVALLLPRRDP
jgi:hypothetical protein